MEASRLLLHKHCAQRLFLASPAPHGQLSSEQAAPAAPVTRLPTRCCSEHSFCTLRTAGTCGPGHSRKTHVGSFKFFINPEQYYCLPSSFRGKPRPGSEVLVNTKAVIASRNAEQRFQATLETILAGASSSLVCK